MLNDSTAPLSSNQPSIITVFELIPPLAVTMDIDLQAEAILSQARLAEFNRGFVLSSLDSSYKLAMGCSLDEILLQLPESIRVQARPDVLGRIKQFVRQGYNLEDISTEWQLFGQLPSHKTSCYGLLSDGFLTRIVIAQRDEAASKKQEQLVLNIAQSLVAETDELFFSHLASRLAQTLGLDYAAVAEVLPDDCEQVRLLAFYNRLSDKHVQLKSTYGLKGTPGLEVLQGETSYYQSSVLEKFPDNNYLLELDVESYLAVPIFGENYRQLGLICLMHRGEMHNVELARSVLNIFAIRASAEIERCRIQKEKDRREQQLHIFIEKNTSGMFVVDIDPPMPTTISIQKQVQWLGDNSRFIECNQAMADILGYGEKNKILGHTLLGDGKAYDFATMARDFISHNYVFRDQLITSSFSQDNTLWLSSNLSSVIEGEKVHQILGVITDVSDRVMHSREMEYRAKHDSLTGLPNRSNFIEQVEQVIKFSSSSSRHALFLLDLDGFKEVNDTLGHETGDYLLRQIGPRVEPILSRAKTLMARLGGDEFAVLVENYASTESVIELASEFIAAIKQAFTVNELELVVGGSVGIALYPASSDSVSSLMRCADVAMYQAKKQSLDYCVYSSDHDHYTMRRLSLMMDIRQAVANNELRLFHQPIICLASRKVMGFEALIRWQHPEHGMLPPGEFIPLIELTDMINPVTNWVVETAIKQLSQWQKAGWDYRISVNVSTRNVMDAGFVSFINNCLQQYQVEGQGLEIEITESSLMADPEKARQVLQAISALGVLISVDDYGTGYSSLAYLKSLPINTLKIDRVFISQLMENTQDQIIVNSTIQLAHNLGLEVTAEGIEDASLIELLGELGCNKGQGFFFSKPMPVEKLYDWLELYNRRIP